MRKTRGSWGETYFRFARLYVPAKLSESRASYFRFPRLYVPAILSESLAQATSVPAPYPGQFALSELPEEAWNRARSISLTGDATSEIAEDDWRRECLSPLATPPTSRKPYLVSKDKERKKKKEMLKCGNVRCNRVSHARQVCLTLRAKPSD